MQLWMGRVYPFTLAIFSLFLATLLARTAPLSENKTKYFLAEWYQKAIHFESGRTQYAQNAINADPLEEIYRLEASRIWDGAQNEMSHLVHSRKNSGVSPTKGYITDPFSNSSTNYLQYPKAQKKELLRIQSTFRGRDYDRAFQMALGLAHGGELDQAMELCQYILSEVPNYVDAEILLGRILAWEGEYLKSSRILEQVIRKYPHYEDGYAALLDTYYWGGDIKRSASLQPFIVRHFKDSSILHEKLLRIESMKQEGLPKPEISAAGDSRGLPVS